MAPSSGPRPPNTVPLPFPIGDDDLFCLPCSQETPPTHRKYCDKSTYAKHLKLYHGSATISFVCRGCGHEETEMRKMTKHRLSSQQCQASLAPASIPSQPDPNGRPAPQRRPRVPTGRTATTRNPAPTVTPPAVPTAQVPNSPPQATVLAPATVPLSRTASPAPSSVPSPAARATVPHSPTPTPESPNPVTPSLTGSPSLPTANPPGTPLGPGHATISRNTRRSVSSPTPELDSSISSLSVDGISDGNGDSRIGSRTTSPNRNPSSPVFIAVRTPPRMPPSTPPSGRASTCPSPDASDPSPVPSTARGSPATGGVLRRHRSQRIGIPQARNRPVTGHPPPPATVPRPISRPGPFPIDDWIRRVSGVSTLGELETFSKDLEEAVIARRPPDPDRPAQPTVPPNPRARKKKRRAEPPLSPQELQALWRRSRARAYAKIVEGSATQCTVPVQDVHSHFTRVHSSAAHATVPVPLPAPRRPRTSDPLSPPITAREVLDRFKRCTDTAPGPDTIRYSEWKNVDPSGRLLSALYCKAQLHGVPSRWKQSETALIHKKGDPSLLTNWRPISLLPTLAKLYGNILSSRLTTWATRHGRLSKSQKGFLPFRGCSEHSFLVKSAIEDARRKNKPLSLAFLDLRNAFGSVPHSTIKEALSWLGLAPTSIDLAFASFTGSCTRVKTADGLTPSIPIDSGVVQGSPLSPILFNMALEPLLRAAARVDPGYSLHGHSVSAAAYADDVCLLAPSTTVLQKQLDRVSELALWAGLEFNPAKCGSITLSGKSNTLEILSLQAAPIPALSDCDPYQYLGTPTGTKSFKSGTDAIVKMTNELEKVDQSCLCPWQKLEAVRSFILPQLSFSLANGSVAKAPLACLDKMIKKCATRWLFLPLRASNEVLYADFDRGGQSLIPLTLLADIATVSHASSLLHSRDASVADLSYRILREVSAKRAQRRVSGSEIALYLSGDSNNVYRTPTVDIPSIWTQARAATRRLITTFPIAWTTVAGSPPLVTLSGSPLSPARVQQTLTKAYRELQYKKLLEKKDQGHTYRTQHIPHLSNHFVREGSFLRFCDWRFINRARLNLLPLNAARRWDQNANKTCRRCGAANETLAHVLSVCPKGMPQFKSRHDLIHDRLKKAIRPSPHTTVTHDHTVPGSGSQLRPDIVFTDHKTKSVVIVDVHLPYDNGEGSIERAHEVKAAKYGPLIQHFEREGFRAEYHSAIVSALGRIPRGTLDALRALRIPSWYTKLLYKLLSADAVKGSRNVYATHMTGQVM